MPNFTILNDCLDLLTLHVDNLSLYNPEHSSLLDNKEKIFEYHIVDFRKELNQNILQASGTEQKQDIITWYISELMRSLNHKPITADPILEAAKTSDPATAEQPGLRKKEILILDLPVDSRNEERFLQGCNILYHLIFNELQECCKIYQIPFLEICMQLQFPADSLSLIPGIEQIRKKDDAIASQEKNPIEELSVEPRLKFIKREIPRILRIFKEYFSEEHFIIFTEIVENGGDAKNPLLFLGKSNQLLNSFKLLANNDIITGCSKKELINWIIRNFTFISSSKKISSISYWHASHVVTDSQYVCKRPILGVKNGHVYKV